MRKLSIFNVIVFALLWSLSSSALAQAITIFGNSSESRDCYTNAKLLHKRKIKSLSYMADVSPCDLALRSSLNRHDRAATLVNRGLIRASLDDLPGAIADYDSAEKINPKVIPITHINRGNAYYLQRNYDGALDSYTTAIDMNVKQIHVAFHNQAMAFEKLGDLDAAAKGFIKALELVEGWESAQLRLDRVRRKQQALK